jgi:hypothetical protein
VICFVAASGAAASWLPDFADGHIGGVAFFVVCGLIAARLAVVGVNVYLLVKDLEGTRLAGGIDTGLVADHVVALLVYAGVLFGLAGIVYLIAPSSSRESSEVSSPEASHPSAEAAPSS